MERGNYLDSSEDNYTDTGLDVLANLAIDKRNSIGIGAIVTRAHEARGTGYSQGLGDLLDEPDTYSNRDGFMVYQRGSNSSRAGLELTAGRSSLDYDGGTLTANRDRFFNYGTARFEIRIRPNSTIFSELNLRDINYDFREEGASSLDSRESDFLLGISWENAARTNATLRVGRGRKNFDEELRDDVSSPRWELELGWLPKTYSNFELFSSRSAQESFGGGNYAEVTSHSIRWAHEWTRRLNTDIGYNISEWDYQGSDRFDNLDGFDASIFYQFRRWLSAGAGISHSAQDSDAEVRTFERNITYIQLNISL
ncbi:exopolysaccharide biosynthesis beta-barrel protein VpsM [Biformimicrobium ophioploci]|uniref:Exopolysaccharide biosynthesis beta-barrel protein VpsM n=2 Tax=Biformimicrobium ophioploci TaxID=3036711 RepID=A0ABQ6M086_9GAMM|nr:exopolysaccharide biosynthesis beta-barrel protein VpsM [Microbulbifer sp. NKW57]